jgi:hypothetical protein
VQIAIYIKASKSEEKPMPPKTNRLQFVMRILPEIKHAAEQAAEAQGRSLSSYIEHLLREQLKREGYLK